MTAMPLTPPARRVRRPFGLDLVPGILTREDFLGLVNATLAVQVVLLLVAVTIDLAKYYDQVMSVAPSGFFAGALHLAWYLGLRIVDMVTRMLPIAVFVGVLGFEIRSVLTRRRAIHWASGRHPVRVAIPVLGVGLVFGGLQYALETQLRPLAVMTQAAARLGSYGERFERHTRADAVWFMSGDRMIHAIVRVGPPTELLDVDLYRIDGEGRVREVIRAAWAEPTELADLWRFHKVTRWARDPADPTNLSVAAHPDEDLVPIALHPLAVEYMGVPAKYIPNGDLEAIARSHTRMLVGADHAVWLEVRRANAFMPLAMAFLAATMSLFAGAYRPSPAVLLACGLSGYAAYVIMRVAVALGELQSLPPLVAAWAPVVLVLAAAAAAAAIAVPRD